MPVLRGENEAMPRKEERIPYLNEVTLSFASGKREARISDLSAGGCFVDTIATIPEGETVSLEMRNGDGRTAELTGTVAYVLPGFGIGIKFTNLSDKNSAFLAELIKHAS
jgi:hypothetical protein